MVLRAGDCAPQKLYRQPSLFTCSLLAVYEVSASPVPKSHKKPSLRYRMYSPTAPAIHSSPSGSQAKVFPQNG